MSRPQDREEAWDKAMDLVSLLRRHVLVQAGPSSDPLWEVHHLVLELEGKLDEIRRRDLELQWVRG